MLPVKRYLAMNTLCRSMTYYQKLHSLQLKGFSPLYARIYLFILMYAVCIYTYACSNNVRNRLLIIVLCLALNMLFYFCLNIHYYCCYYMAFSYALVK